MAGMLLGLLMQSNGSFQNAHFGFRNWLSRLEKSGHFRKDEWGSCQFVEDGISTQNRPQFATALLQSRLKIGIAFGAVKRKQSQA